MRTLVPFEAARPKTRLDPFLDDDERAAFARSMLRDVIGAVERAGHDPEVVATAPLELSSASVSVPVAVDDRPLSAAVNARLDGVDANDPVAVLVSDLGLVTPAAVCRLVDAEGADADADAGVAIAPGRGGGTNGLVVSHPEFRVDFHGTSYRDHRRTARAVGASVRVVDSMRLSTDVDEPEDLVEVLLHGEGAAAAWLRSAGVGLGGGDGGRVEVTRSGEG
ncbi:2-phospho-L-lactate guanylyltransferase [Haloplanus sp.]|uniref:2-phospho-L-lactate guanylyltransferase n=1 Tax=Haloplanus sp. TaxID=1961696 RepID=UPI00263055B6|nr:2-phospho-L-lactate guanylyltransferase [Haloplanus sp.]